MSYRRRRVAEPLPLRIAVIGMGKIAHDRHLPAIAADPGFTLAATVSRSNTAADVPHFADIAALLASDVAVDAVAICTPPGPRFAIAQTALAAGLDVLLEKPPAVSLGEARTLATLAAGRTLFAAWHSRFAVGVEPARAALAGARIVSVTTRWREDVRRWHPGQDWIWAADGFGVLDPGINALSILTRILPIPLVLAAARLEYPANRAAPIAARLMLSGPGLSDAECDFDWRHTGADCWCITVTTTAGQTVQLGDGGARLSIDGITVPLPENAEYSGLYRHFAALCTARASDFDLDPLALALAAVDTGTRATVARFDALCQP